MNSPIDPTASPSPSPVLSSSPSPSPSAPAGWFPEPENPGMLRYWNGKAWEDFRQPATAAPIAPAPANGLAVTSLVFSLVGIALDLTVILGVVGFLCAIDGANVGRVAIRRSSKLGRRGMARWGYWLGTVTVLLQIIVVVLFFFLARGPFSNR